MGKKVLSSILIASLTLPQFSFAINPQNESQKQEKQDCYLEGMRAGELDGSSMGVGVGLLSGGLFSFIGWAIGTVAYANIPPKVPYEKSRHYEGDCRYDFDRGYQEGARKTRNRNFHSIAGVCAIGWAVLVLSTDTE
tara:strand:+ start:100 stop:510 length:411 start_codon:yes stop_codon:yes gene_type:complete